MTTTEQVQIAADNGILMPVRAAEAAAVAGIGFYVACAFLEQETGGGRNIYGHDRDADGVPRPFWGHGRVTEANYRCYLVERDMFVGQPEGRRAQGVGPMQLTWYEFQDRADAQGGCWDPDVNMLVAFAVIASYIGDQVNATTLHEAARRYNGRESYADEMDAKFRKWRNLLT